MFKNVQVKSIRPAEVRHVEQQIASFKIGTVEIIGESDLQVMHFYHQNIELIKRYQSEKVPRVFEAKDVPLNMKNKSISWGENVDIMASFIKDWLNIEEQSPSGFSNTASLSIRVLYNFLKGAQDDIKSGRLKLDMKTGKLIASESSYSNVANFPTNRPNAAHRGNVEDANWVFQMLLDNIEIIFSHPCVKSQVIEKLIEILNLQVSGRNECVLNQSVTKALTRLKAQGLIQYSKLGWQLKQ